MIKNNWHKIKQLNNYLEMNIYWSPLGRKVFFSLFFVALVTIPLWHLILDGFENIDQLHLLMDLALAVISSLGMFSIAFYMKKTFKLSFLGMIIGFLTSSFINLHQSGFDSQYILTNFLVIASVSIIMLSPFYSFATVFCVIAGVLSVSFLNLDNTMIKPYLLVSLLYLLIYSIASIIRYNIQIASFKNYRSINDIMKSMGSMYLKISTDMVIQELSGSIHEFKNLNSSSIGKTMAQCFSLEFNNLVNAAIYSKESSFHYSIKGQHYIVQLRYYNLVDNEVYLLINNNTDMVNSQKIKKETEMVQTITAQMAEVGEMTSGIIHEINNPLMVIKGKLRLLFKKLNAELENDAKLISLQDSITKNLTKVNNIVHSMRMMSRNGENDEFENANLSVILQDAIELTRYKLAKAGVSLLVSDYDKSLKLSCKEVQIGQVFVNLINNACDAIEMIEDRWIKISIREYPNSLRLEVSDSGRGIPRDIQGRIVEPFFTTKKTGTGLGLSMINKIIQNHKGRFFLDSKSENTCFVIELPINVQNKLESIV